ncbi:MAG: holo-[acyl-carrier-protein] synthase [Candidatus Solincola sediminis]|uniref:Holo-[acyl-carrier-protein] synthase n=1 Tax=Candidatus Solincola sediminis TaxID=1797199 RepID=A0A1F2WIF5_9ACTN|nr:MAG: holo-[acyl-carrier-protein] synthase [Candidatus Solincola sediminis]OFW60695.1 MAG: holo-[acyl-carrier-protein] synthase [Candidatus Solincola sediminis]
MDIKGIGIDLVEIARIERAITRHDNFVSRVFSSRERERCERSSRPGRRYAACFAAKEAASKALGTGVRGFGLREVEMLEDELGRPILVLSGKAGETAERRGITEIMVSVSHSGELAVAIAQAVG